jgi:hypothetical protein
MSTALVESGKWKASDKGGIYGINATESSMLLVSSSVYKRSLEVLLNNATSSTLLAAATTSTPPAAVASSTLPAAGSSSTIQVAVTSFTPSVSNSHSEDLSEAKNKCDVAKIGGTKPEAKQLKRR